MSNDKTEALTRFEWVLSQYMQGNASRDDVDEARHVLSNALAAAPQAPQGCLPSEDKARQAFWGCYPDTGNGDMSEVWMTAFRWCRAMLAASPQAPAEQPGRRVECDACPTSLGCIGKCMKSAAQQEPQGPGLNVELT